MNTSSIGRKGYCANCYEKRPPDAKAPTPLRKSAPLATESPAKSAGCSQPTLLGSATTGRSVGPDTKRVRNQGNMSGSQDREAELKSIMLIAWGFHRTAVADGRPRPFSVSLRAAWSWKKRMKTYLSLRPLVQGTNTFGAVGARQKGWGRRGARYLTAVIGN